MSALEKFQSRWSYLPIFGPLAYCTKSDHKKAIKEFLMSFCFSTTSFWVSAVVFRLFKSNADKSYLYLLRGTISNGELLIFSVSFLGPVFLTAIVDPNGRREFPGRFWHTGALLLVSGLSALIFAVNKAFHSITLPGAVGSLAQYIDVDLIVTYSLWLALIAMVIRYLTIVYTKSMQSPDETMLNDDLTFSERWKKHRGVK